MAKVKVFTTVTCPYCHALKNYLKEKKVNFEEVNLNEHPEEVRTLVDTCGNMGVPCTHIEVDGKEESILGFDKERIDKVLNLS